MSHLIYSIVSIYRDLKCENLLLDNANLIKVTDFGFARQFEAGDISKTFCGSAAYAAPEILQGQPYQLPLHDIWAMGIILYIMVSFHYHYFSSTSYFWAKGIIRYIRVHFNECLLFFCY